MTNKNGRESQCSTSRSLMASTHNDNMFSHSNEGHSNEQFECFDVVSVKKVSSKPPRGHIVTGAG